MSKDFKQEYKQYKLDETPDLWDRIEAGLEPREKVSLQDKPISPDTPKRKKISYVSFAGIAAACLIMLLILPNIIRGNVAGSNGAPKQEVIYETSIEMDSVKADMDQTESMGAPSSEGNIESADAGNSNGDEAQVMVGESQEIKSESQKENPKAEGKTKSREITVKIIQLPPVKTKTEPLLLQVEIEKSTETDLPKGTLIEVIAEQTLASSIQENHSYQIQIIEKWNSSTENVEYYLDKVLVHNS